jgi:hypothetical protein
LQAGIPVPYTRIIFRTVKSFHPAVGQGEYYLICINEMDQKTINFMYFGCSYGQQRIKN